jgi:hypothetical protein
MQAMRFVRGIVLVALLAGAALAVQEDALEKARALVAEAKPYVEKANDPDLGMEERKAPRKEAFKRLKEARALYDTYLDANPAEVEKLDQEYVEAMVLLFAIKKDSGLGELEKNPEPPHATPPAPPPGTAPPVAPTAKEALAAIREYEKAHPGDLPHVQSLSIKFLADFADPALPEFAEESEHLGKLSDRIKSVFQAAAKHDYDSISSSDSKEENAIVKRLTADLRSKDAEVRRRAARLMVATRLRAVTPELARGIVDKDETIAKTCREGLVTIGGSAAGDALITPYCFGPKENQRVAMGVFQALIAKGGMEAAYQCRAIGRFTNSAADDVTAQAFAMLKSMGKAGGPGLLVAIVSTGDLDKKAEIMGRVVEAKYWRGATFLAERFLVAANGDPSAPFLYTAAWNAIEKMGVYAVPYLITAMTGASGRYTAALVSKITKVPVEPNEQEKVRDWWVSHKPKDAD